MVDTPMHFEFIDRGNECAVILHVAGYGQFESIMPAAQMVEMGQAMIETGSRVIAREGAEMAGEAHRAAVIQLPAIRYQLRAEASL